MEVETAKLLLSLALQYGVPAVVSEIDALGKGTITAEDIEELKEMIKKPEDY